MYAYVGGKSISHVDKMGLNFFPPLAPGNPEDYRDPDDGPSPADVFVLYIACVAGCVAQKAIMDIATGAAGAIATTLCLGAINAGGKDAAMECYDSISETLGDYKRCDFENKVDCILNCDKLKNEVLYE